MSEGVLALMAIFLSWGKQNAQSYLCNRNLESVLRDRIGSFVGEFGENVDNGLVCLAARDIKDDTYFLLRDRKGSRGWQAIFR